jgi:cytochrome c
MMFSSFIEPLVLPTDHGRKRISVSRKWVVSLSLIAFIGIFLGINTRIMASERATKAECITFVKKAVEYVKTNGNQKAFDAFSDPKGAFIDRDLYIIVYDQNGMTLAHGRNKFLVGKNRLDEQDPDGVYFNRERVEMMKTQSSFWTHYKITDPITHKIMPKLAYCEVVDNVTPRLLVCSGVYDAEQIE